MSIYRTIAKMCTKKSDILPEEVDQSSWNDLKILRSITGIVEQAEIDKILVNYALSVEIIISKYPEFTRQERIDWAIARAMSPEWFGDHLTDRMNNTMLVSALLLTVTAAYFVVAPEFDIGDAGKDSTTLRLFFFLNGIASILFIVSIVIGITFIENALSRAYNDADKFVLIISQYNIRNVSQITSILGAVIFNIALFVPEYGLHRRSDSVILTVIAGLFAAYTIYSQLTAINLAAARQHYRMAKFRPLVDDEARLFPKWYPQSAEISQADVIDMFK